MAVVGLWEYAVGPSKRKEITIYDTFYTVYIHKVVEIVIRETVGVVDQTCNNEWQLFWFWKREMVTKQKRKR